MRLKGYDRWLDPPDDDYSEYHEEVRTCGKHRQKFVGEYCPKCEQDIDDYEWDRCAG